MQKLKYILNFYIIVLKVLIVEKIIFDLNQGFIKILCCNMLPVIASGFEHQIRGMYI